MSILLSIMQCVIHIYLLLTEMISSCKLGVRHQWQQGEVGDWQPAEHKVGD